MMSQILNKIRDVDTNNSDAIKDALSTFFQNLSKHTEADCYTWLRVLENSINRFPKYCISNRNTIETYLVHFLDSNNYYNVIEAAKCAHALQQVRSSQEKTSTPKANWRELMNALCNAAHLLMASIFTGSVNMYKEVEKQTPQSFNSPLLKVLCEISNVSAKQNTQIANKQSILCTRLRNVFVFMQAMFVEIYPVGKPVRPQTVLDVIVRALTISSGKGSFDILQVVTVKTQALRTLDALIACLGSNLIPFSPLVFRFVMQTLKWSSENDCDETRTVKCSAYKTLTLWLNTLRSHRAADRGRGWQDSLTSHLLGDVTPPTYLVQLTPSNQSMKNLSKKARRKLQNTMLKESSIATHMPGEKHKNNITDEKSEEMAIAALQCAETFLIVCGIFLKPTTHKLFQERLVRECHRLSAHGGRRGACCLRALDASRRASPPTAPPPTQHCLQLYSALVASDDPEISKFCCQALLDIRLHLHCSPPSLNFAVITEETQVNDRNRKIVSGRNRAALEALLGHDRVPLASVDEIITIPDEPASKKARLESTEDRVSVSSDSITFENSDDSEETCSIQQEVKAIIEDVNEDNEKDDCEVIECSNETMEANDNKVVEKHNKDSANTTLEDIAVRIDSSGKSNENEANIYDAKTQMPNTGSDGNYEDRPLSMEVTYGDSTDTEKVTILDKFDDENLPSSNDTDDVQINCGQDIKLSLDNNKPDDLEVKKDEVKVNGINNFSEKSIVNGDVDTTDGVNEGTTNIDEPKEKVVNVADMLADFVDEVNENIVS